jgi:hypothetical protein
MACFSYIEGWYNPLRLHSGLGYRSRHPRRRRCGAVIPTVLSTVDTVFLGHVRRDRDAIPVACPCTFAQAPDTASRPTRCWRI